MLGARGAEGRGETETSVRRMGLAAPVGPGTACGHKRAPRSTARPTPSGGPHPCFPAPGPSRRLHSPASYLREPTQLPRYLPCAPQRSLPLSNYNPPPPTPSFSSAHLGSPSPLPRVCPHPLCMHPTRPCDPQPRSSEGTQRAVAAPVSAPLAAASVRWAPAGSALRTSLPSPAGTSKPFPAQRSGFRLRKTDFFTLTPILFGLRCQPTTYNSAWKRKMLKSKIVSYLLLIAVDPFTMLTLC